MKLHILSDLHLEFFDFAPPPTDADIVILAGDISTGTHAVPWAAKAFAGKPVLYVPGNHEPYGYELADWRSRLTAVEAQQSVVTVADCKAMTVPQTNGRAVRILGTTLWTDFALFGAGQKEHVARLSERCLFDYREITHENRRLRWHDTAEIHERSLRWLKEQCADARARGETVVVVSHHAPSLKSSAPRFLHDPVTAGFASDLEAFADEYVTLWVHGHMHNSSDYQLGNCRVVANPRGYPDERSNPNTRFENPEFNPGLVMEV